MAGVPGVVPRANTVAGVPGVVPRANTVAKLANSRQTPDPRVTGLVQSVPVTCIVLRAMWITGKPGGFLLFGAARVSQPTA
jgi:hypothetical protein